MPLSHVLGNVLVSDDELIERAGRDDPETAAFRAEIDRLQEGERGDHQVRIALSSGVVHASEVTPFAPVGVGLPATILLRHVYTGRLGKNDMLLTSAVRDPFTTFNEAPRAINLMPKRVRRKSHITGPAATENGTELVYYIPALTAQSLTLTFDMAFDDFPDELVSRIAGAISSAGSIPVFGPYSGIILAAGAAIKLLSKLVNSLVDARPEFSVTERLDFNVPGSPVPQSGFKIVHGRSLDPAGFEFDVQKGLIHKDTKRPYDGDEPYIAYLLDGGKNDSFKEFTPTAASAAMLSRFLSQKEGSEVAIDAITDAFKLYNDLRYRQEADRLQKQIDKLPADSEERKTLEARRKAALDNILQDLLRP
ncbi:MAG TPA: hypothetical protein VF584_15970 [Longimicrobium sp.]|jgi:hypothetical protein